MCLVVVALLCSSSLLRFVFFFFASLCAVLKQAGVPAIAIEMTSMASGATKMEPNPLQAMVQQDKEEVKKTQGSSSATGTYIALNESHHKGFQKETAPAIPLREVVTDGVGEKVPPPIPARLSNDLTTNDNPTSLSIRSSFESRFDHAAAAPPEERTQRSRRRVQRRNRELPVPSTPTTPHAASPSLFSEMEKTGGAAAVPVATAMGFGNLLYERPDHCRVFELSWKLAGGSKALLYSFKD